MNTYTLTMVVLATLSANAFIITYLRSPWWSTLPGRSAMLKGTVLAVVLDLIILSRVFDVRLPEWAGAGIWTALAVALWVQLVSYLRVQNSKDARNQVRVDDMDRSSEP